MDDLFSCLNDLTFRYLFIFSPLSVVVDAVVAVDPVSADSMSKFPCVRCPCSPASDVLFPRSCATRQGEGEWSMLGRGQGEWSM